MNDWDREVFARTIWMEARGESNEGKRCVAHAIWNRYRSKKYGDAPTIAGVCMFDQQFSCWNAAKDDHNRETMNSLYYFDPVLEVCRVIVKAVEQGEHDPVKGARHYYSIDIPAPKWVSKGVFVVQEGKHRFYKDVP